MRKWLVAAVLRRVSAAIDKSWHLRGTLKPEGAAAQSGATASSSALYGAKKTGGFSFGGSKLGAKKPGGFAFGKSGGGFKTNKPAELSEADKAARAESRLRRQIQKIKTYLNVLGSSSEDYVIHRLRQLVSGSVLAAFSWSSGGEWKGRPWTPELPTDSQIVMHMFVTFMDQNMPAFDETSQTPFTSRHFVPVSGETDTTKSSDVKIVQCSVHPPHFRVVTKVGTWEVLHGRNNLFHNLILFAYYVKMHKNGFLHQVDLSGDAIGLLKVIDMYM